MADNNKTVSLVLGSGGARGHAHLGVIKAIEERGLEIRNIAGTSIGAVIGGVYAADELDTYRDWAFRLSKTDVLKLLDFSFTWTAIFEGERIFSVLKELIGDCDIEELDRGFVAVATDLVGQREVWLNRGSLFDAVRASTAVPGVFKPVERDNRILVDGGLVNPIPIAPTLNDPTDLTIAVNLNAIDEQYHATDRAAEIREQDDADDDGYRAAISRFVSNLMTSDDEKAAPPGATDLLTMSIDVMQGAIARLKLAAYTPHKVIDIPRDAATFFEFDRAEEMAELGYERTLASLDDLQL